VQDVMLDLGSNMNILLKKLWEIMGIPQLVYSHIQMWLANQYKMYHIGFLEYVEVNIKTMKTMVDLEVIKIFNEKDIYPTSLRFNGPMTMNP
jgi:hypothetical protein